MNRKSIVVRRKRHRVQRAFDLQITSLMDILIILVVFLLKSYAATAVAFATSPNITLPTSSAEEIPPDSVNLVVDPAGITFDGTKVVDFKIPPGVEPKAETATYEIEKHLMADGGRRILPLYDAMVKSREKAELLMSKAKWVVPAAGAAGEKTVVPPKFQGIVIIQADKAVRYELLRRIMYTAGAARYRIFKLVSISKESG